MRILVTGCAGFIGWKVSELLLGADHTVVGVDNLNDAYDPGLKEWRLTQLQAESGFNFHRLDIEDRQAMAGVLQAHRIDAVVNLAARAGVRQSLENPWVYYQTNVVGTLNLLELCIQMGVGKFVLASTSSLYGEGDLPFREDSCTDRPLSPYAASKKAAEVTSYTYHRLHGIAVTVLRYFTVYGPAGRPDMSVFRFIRQISEDECVTLYGDGSQERDFTYVDDVARGTVAALKPTGFETVNLGSDRPLALRRVIEEIERCVGKRAHVATLPSHPTDAPATWADITKAREVLGWRPQVEFEVGVQRAVEWYNQNRHWAKDLDLAV